MQNPPASSYKSPVMLEYEMLRMIPDYKEKKE